jgi:hypothetical protein
MSSQELRTNLLSTWMMMMSGREGGKEGPHMDDELYE